MATHLSGSNAVQTDSLQTLYLLNPSCTEYSDSSKQGSMVLISPTSGAVGQGSSLGNSGQQQQEQHYNEFSLPLPGLTQLPLSQQFHIAAMPNSNMGHLNAPSNVFPSHLSNYGYNWNVGSEVSFFPSRDTTEDSQPLPSQINFMNSRQHSTSELSQYDLRTSQKSLQEQPTSIPNGIALGLNMGNLQAPSGAGQILSLSLSPQQPSVIQLPPFAMQHSGTTVSSCPGFSNASIDHDQGKMDRVPNKCMEGSLSSFRGFSEERILETSYQTQVNGAGSNRLAHMMSSSLPIEVYGSKYLREAQQLLDEMVSIGSGLKRNTFKYAQLLSSMGPGSLKDGSFSKGRIPAENNGNHRQPVVTWSGKDVASTVTALPSHTEGIPEHATEIDVQLGQAGRQELQMKKAKLMSMLNEVDQRYKEYYQQMQIVVASFESAAGLGAARTYTALALQTISKNFRCLRDAIYRHIRVTRRALGEEEFSGHGRREASHFSSADQQLLQQHALQQFGMMQQHAWRPQRGLPERAVSVLRTWLFEHFLHPYPKDSDKLLLARQTGLSRNQVSNWFINARVRLWKPMVEEMYSEEIRDEDVEEADKPVQNGGVFMNKGSRSMDSAGNSDCKKLLQGNEEEFTEQRIGSNLVSDMRQSKTLIGSSSENLFFCERETMRQGVKKARNENQGSASLLLPDSSINMDCETNEALTKGALGHDIAIRTEVGQENYAVSNSGFMKTDHQNIGVYGTLQINGLNRLPQEALTARCAANSGVSLTLGLQHREGFLSVSGAQQHYTQGQGQFISTGRQQDCGDTAIDYYSTRGNAGRHTNSYDAMNLQHGK